MLVAEGIENAKGGRAEFECVPGSGFRLFSTSGSADFSNASSAASLPGLAFRRTYRARFLLMIDPNKKHKDEDTRHYA
jgi:hypothetical protein